MPAMNCDLWPIGWGMIAFAVMGWTIFRHSKWYVDRK